MKPIVIIIALLLLISVVTIPVITTARRAANSLVYPPHKAITTTPTHSGISEWEDVTFSSGNWTLGGWFIPPTSEVDGATLIFVHGFGANREALLEQAAVLHQQGYGALLIDLRNSGNSEGDVTSWGYEEVEDVKAAFAYLQTRPEVNPARIGLVGKSAGGAAVVRAAVQLPETWVVILESSYTSLEDNMPAITQNIAHVSATYSPLVYGWMKQMTGLPLDEIRPIDDLPYLTAPILFIHGDQDGVVNLSHSQRMFQAANEPKQLFIVPGGNHMNIFTIDSVGFESQVLTFLESATP